MRDDSRRRFVQKALAAGAAGAIVGPVASQPAALVKTAKPIVFKFQSTWPTKDIFNEFAQDFAKKVNDMSGGSCASMCTPPTA